MQYESIFSNLRRAILVHGILQIATLISFSVLAQRTHWLLAFALFAFLQSITTSVLAIILHPSHWAQSDRTHLNDDAILAKALLLRSLYQETRPPHLIYHEKPLTHQLIENPEE